jgi:hypothetical protein
VNGHGAPLSKRIKCSTARRTLDREANFLDTTKMATGLAPPVSIAGLGGNKS